MMPTHHPDPHPAPGRAVDGPTAEMVGPVRYHGSLTEHHGAALCLGYCPCPDCRAFAAASDAYHRTAFAGDGLGDERFTLQLPEGGVLSHVRADSFTPCAQHVRPATPRRPPRAPPTPERSERTSP
ncbi:hypothetical protein GCM10011594_31750 [Nakamurella endophytica]|uniref:Uncharacterized protein n=1 Tax=Nakamurella endophytica TaxID=1748367 RepID=A0A917WJY1_9ACTN|nr:hypothetical protein GCM10011594_31750 [Nakamurella endophytica]